jgi:hypothetical protein
MPIKAEAGRNEGLFVVLDAHSDQIGGVSVNSDFEGFTGFIDKRGSYPMPSLRGFQIRPGSSFTDQGCKVPKNKINAKFGHK